MIPRTLAVVCLFLNLASCSQSPPPAPENVPAPPPVTQAPAATPPAPQSTTEPASIPAPSAASSVTPPQAAFEKLACKHLPNAIRLNEKVISGGLPDGDAGFAELEALGVQTVVSVDGALPEVELAKARGMRYVHLPHGYDGVPEERGRQLAKAVHDLPGRIYIHCHHGKHRSPAAAAVACVTARMMSSDQVDDLLALAGTSPNYRGLFQSAEQARPLGEAELAAVAADFPETAKIPPLAEAMVSIEHLHDLLKVLENNEWRAPANHPGIDPAHEALLLRESFTELLRTEDTRKRPPRYQELVLASEAACESLEKALRSPSGETADQAAARAAFAGVTGNCQACHKEFRDVPLSEKAKK